MADEDKTLESDPAKDDKSTKTFTQEQLEAELKKRLDRERAKFADYDDLKAFKATADAKADNDKTDAEKLREEMADVKANLEAERVTRLRLEVAAEKGLTPAQAKRLNGASKEELEADADELLTVFPAPEQETGSQASRLQRRPVPNLKQVERSGGNNPSESDVDVKSLVDSIPPTA